MMKTKREICDCIIGGLWGVALVAAACWGFNTEYQKESEPGRHDLYTMADSIAQMPTCDTHSANQEFKDTMNMFLAPVPSEAQEVPNPNCIVGIMKANREFYENTYEYHVIDEPTVSLILKIRNGVCDLLGI